MTLRLLENTANTRWLRLWTAASVLALLGAVPAALASPYSFKEVTRIIALSDPHGAYDALVRTLRNADVLDSDGRWAAADAHLVITGDLLDRGADSRQVMDLVMRLEEQSVASGGKVHLLLGNHEVMNLVGDLRYVASGEYAAFAEDENPEDREHWFRLFAAERLGAGETDQAALRAEFDRQRPPGFFGHRRAFAADGYYGKWLLQKPLLVVVNGNAFVHGGLPPLVAELGLDALNDRLMTDVAEYVEALGLLYEAGMVDPALNFYEHAQRASSLAVMTPMDDEIGGALRKISDLSGSDVHAPTGPLWYRGNVGCSALVESDRLAAALQAIGADRLVIGHTPTMTRGVLQRYDGRVIEIDTGMLNAAYQGSGHALILEDEDMWVVSEHSAERQPVAPHPRRVGYRPKNLSVEDLEQLLAHGAIVSSSTDARKRTIVEIREDDVNIAAVFSRNSNRKGLHPGLAAYRLDRLLGLDMVPVTVSREVDGDAGALQYLPANVRDEQQRVESRQGSGAWCPLPEQWNSMYLFDALIYNPGRPPTNMLYNIENWQMVLVGYEGTFGTRGERPKYLEQAPLELTGEWRRRLTALNEAGLSEVMGDALDRRRIQALLKRRDHLLMAP